MSATRKPTHAAHPVLITGAAGRLISVAREEGSLDDIRAVLGNDQAIDSYRAERLPFPNGTIIARLAWSYEASDENNRVFGRPQSFVAGQLTNVEFMIKDSKRFADSGGWGYAVFDYNAASDSFAPGTTTSIPAQGNDASCGFACHTGVKSRDYVFTDYARR